MPSRPPLWKCGRRRFGVSLFQASLYGVIDRTQPPDRPEGVGTLLATIKPREPSEQVGKDPPVSEEPLKIREKEPVKPLHRRIYWAAPLFTDAQRKFNYHRVAGLRSLDLDVVLPHEFSANRPDTDPSALDIFIGDTDRSLAVI